MNKAFAIGILFSIGLILMMLILPIPTPVLDILIAVNILFALMILIVVLYNKKITDFTLLPTLLLELTVFSMAVSISVTRLILTRGVKFDGRLIRFVSFLFTGSGGIEHLITGFTIFMVIAAISTLVITKGATRVSEVAARFTLDSMQVKLMAIEVEYNSGEINEEEAVSQKAAIQKESDFYNALDGFSKFLSGNVKVNLFIISLISIGGTLIDTLYRGIPVNNAIGTFIPLAIGSGIFFMLPPFLLSIAVGCLVTRKVNKYFGSGIS